MAMVLGLWMLPRLGLAPAWAQASYFFHEVKPGETLWSISRAYGTSVERLEEFNGGERVGHSIKSGEFLVIPAEMLVVAQRMAVSPEALHKASAADAVLPDEVFAAPVRPSSVYGEDELVAILPGSVFGASQASPSAGGEGVAPSAVVLGEGPAAPAKPQAPPAGKGKVAPASGSKASGSAPKAARDKGLVAVAPASVFGNAAAPSGAGQKTASPKPSGTHGQKAVPAQAGSQPKAQDKGQNAASGITWHKPQEGKPSSGGAKAGGKGKAGGQGQATKSVDEMLAFARKFIGTPYVYGGDTPAGFDCSGYVQSVCRYAGVRIPRVADEQYYKAGRPIPKGQEQAGDLVFFETDPSWPGPSHVGICLGGGEFIHASSSGSVRVDKLSKDYYRTRFLGSKRVIEQS